MTVWSDDWTDESRKYEKRKIISEKRHSDQCFRAFHRKYKSLCTCSETESAHNTLHWHPSRKRTLQSSILGNFTSAFSHKPVSLVFSALNTAVMEAHLWMNFKAQVKHTRGNQPISEHTTLQLPDPWKFICSKDSQRLNTAGLSCRHSIQEEDESQVSNLNMCCCEMCVSTPKQKPKV